MKHWRVLLEVVDDGVGDRSDKSYMSRESITQHIEDADVKCAGLTLHTLDAFVVPEEE